MTDVDVSKPQDGAIGRRAYFLFTLAVVALGWVIAAANTGISYLALGLDAIPIFAGFLGCCVFTIVLRFLHCAWWLAFLSLLPALLVLVGSVQYPIEAALDSRGVRESVLVTADENHRYTLVGRLGELKETLEYEEGERKYQVGDRVEVIHDPEGVVPLEEASDVDPGGRLFGLILGVVGWTGITLLAGRRGFVRRRAGRRPLLDDVS
ncbi:hypothetical protein [Streptomyces vilmorinianum]|uniref:hypothetical protein n=1 Tax=Streptomyces vilmorinianum TaxID=3051092 RepID=UPI0020C7D8D2|nr:hypothetical protein [Streptomyces vilmorinianum]